MKDDEIRDELERGLRAYNPPPEMPRDRIWAAIQAAGDGDEVIDIGPGSPRRLLARRIRVATALAASLVLFLAGAGVGYVARGGEGPPSEGRVADAGPAQEPVLYHVTWF